ncbi:MAG TPA: hypothetical protein VFW45_11455 [Candidatus Polarisedimenticolia bacterium]|nr:hypothetical protein [Candidatus Polarisedimenticolia bacterium]
MAMWSDLKLASLALLASLATGPSISIETRTLAPVAPEEKGVHLILNQRTVAEGKIILMSRTIQPDGSVFFSQREYKMDGTPVSSWQEGAWSNRWNRFETRYGSKGAEQHINEKINKTTLPNRTFRDPTVLWFWRTRPKVNESVVVTYLAQNVIETSQIRYTYEGDEEMTLAGRKVKVHRVREDPVGTQGVYTTWWYDDQGMGVKRFHKTTQHEYTDDLVAWK